MEIVGYLIVPSTIIDSLVDKSSLQTELEAKRAEINLLNTKKEIIEVELDTIYEYGDPIKTVITKEEYDKLDDRYRTVETKYETVEGDDGDDDQKAVTTYYRLTYKTVTVKAGLEKYLTASTNLQEITSIYTQYRNYAGAYMNDLNGNVDSSNVDSNILSSVRTELEKYVKYRTKYNSYLSDVNTYKPCYEAALNILGANALNDYQTLLNNIKTVQTRVKILEVATKDTTNVKVKVDKNTYYIQGKRTGRTDVKEYIFSLVCRVLVKDTTPIIDEQGGTEYDRYSIVNRAVKMICDDNMDIISHDAFDTVAYEQITINTDEVDDNGRIVTEDKDLLLTVPADKFKGLSIVDLIDVNDIQYGIIKKIIDTSIDEIQKVQLPDLDWPNIFKRKGGNYADIYLDPAFSQITNGKIETEQVIQTTGVEGTKYVWKGDYPLDRLIYTIQSNLDILMANQKIKGDVYGNLYATMMTQAIQSATVLEQARIQAYEQASQFQIKSMLEYYLGCITAKLNVVKALAEVQVTFLQKSIAKAQVKLYNVQTNGFKSNNINKLFSAQLDGATTSFSAGMTETPPAVYGNAELMSLYTQVGSDMLLM